MGVDLTLMPLTSKHSWVSHDLIDVSRGYDLFRQIEAMELNKVPETVTCFRSRRGDGDPCYGEVETNPYGDKLTWLAAGDLLSVAYHEDVLDNWRNRAVWAYLVQMPEDWPIVLYWH